MGPIGRGDGLADALDHARRGTDALWHGASPVIARPLLGALLDEVAVARMPQPRRQAEQRIERGSQVAAPVPAIDEFVEVSAQVSPADAMVSAKSPPLEVREDAVNPG